MRVSNLDTNCVCANETLGKCNAVNQTAFNLGHKCSGCAFRKTEAEYIKQMGHTYEEEMREVRKYGKF